MTPFIAEIIGTMLLILLGNGVVANCLLKGTLGNNGGWLLINLAWGLAVYVAVVVAGPISGAHLNPAVSIGLAVAGKFAWGEVGSYVLAQFIGACLGSILVWLSYRDHYAATDDVDAKLGTFATGAVYRNPVFNVLTELIGAFVLVFTALYIAGPSFEAKGISDVSFGLGAVGALPIALTVVVIGMSLGGATGYAINPARDLGPRVMHSILPIGKKRDGDWSYSWIPIVGPVLGATAAALLYNAF